MTVFEKWTSLKKRINDGCASFLAYKAEAEDIIKTQSGQIVQLPSRINTSRGEIQVESAIGIRFCGYRGGGILRGDKMIQDGHCIISLKGTEEIAILLEKFNTGMFLSFWEAEERARP